VVIGYRRLAALSVGKLFAVLALLVVPGLVVAGTTLLIDLWGRRAQRAADFAYGTSIAEEAQRWLDAQR
jgi:hypothetical protein